MRIMIAIAALLAVLFGAACDWEPSDDPNCCQTRPSGSP
jgi:hypothetical protein